MSAVVELARDTTAACRTVDPELFFSQPGTRTSGYAKKVCDRCPLVDLCLDYALAYALEGVWGGLDEKERKKIQRRNGIVPLQIITNPYPRQARAS